MSFYKIVNGDNFDGDYPDEKFLSMTNSQGHTHVAVFPTKEKAQHIANALNDGASNSTPRWWKVVDSDYVLSPGFEP